MHDVPLALQGEALHIKDRQFFAGYLIGDGFVGEQGDAQSGDDPFLDRFDAAEYV